MNEWIIRFIVAVTGLVGGGGIIALYNAVAKKDKEKRDDNTNLMKYFTDKIQEMNDATNERLNKMQKENDELRSELTEMNRKLTELNRWIMVDNAAYRSWLENELRKRDPDIDIPTCSPPPNVFQGEAPVQSHDTEDDTNTED